MTRAALYLSLCAVTLTLMSCGTVHRSAMQALPANPDHRTKTLAEVKDALDGADRAQPALAVPMISASEAPLISGLGFAQISGQPGKTANEKRLMAMRAARMDALRDLAEQVHGIRIDAQTTVSDMVVANDHLSAVVKGSIRGARTIRITPKGTDGYEVKMALDRDTVGYILRAARGAL